MALAGNRVAFKGKWGNLFARTTRSATSHNVSLRALNETAAQENLLPKYVSVDKLKFMVVSMDDQVAAYFDTICGRTDFHGAFLRAFQEAAAYLVEFEPSPHGPRLLDGSWNEGVTETFRTQPAANPT